MCVCTQPFRSYFTENLVCFIKINKYTKQCKKDIVLSSATSPLGFPSRCGPANGVEDITKITGGFSRGLLQKVGRDELGCLERRARTWVNATACIKGQPAFPSSEGVTSALCQGQS